MHLFTQQATHKAEELIGLLAEYDMIMTLPKGAPTLQHLRSKKFSRPDNVFCTPAVADLVYKCEVIPALRPALTDHFPIETHIQLPQETSTTTPSYNFRETDWEKFRQSLQLKLLHSPEEPVITNTEQLNDAIGHLTMALQETIKMTTTRSKPRPDAKRWWNGDLKKMKKELNKLRSQSYTYRALADHSSHRILKVKSTPYGEMILHTKRQHWATYLEDMTASDIWTDNKFIKEPAGDGGSPR